MSGVYARAALIASVYSRGVRLTPATRVKGGYDNSKLLHFVSGDISRIDSASQWFVSLSYPYFVSDPTYMRYDPWFYQG